MATRLLAVHACENDRGRPGGGLVPWKEIFSTLREIRFDGYMALEGYNSSLGDFAYQRGMFHDVCPDGPEFVREGIRFLREMAARYSLELRGNCLDFDTSSACSLPN